VLETLVEVRGSQSAPVRGLNFVGLHWKHSAPTFMKQYTTPSCGDWSLYPGGALMLEGVEGAQLYGNTFDGSGGNSIFARGYVARTNITRNRFKVGAVSVCCGRPSVCTGNCTCADITRNRFKVSVC
jgi:hypothetical protein